MKLGELFSARETISRLYSVRIKNGAAAFRLRREIKKLNEEIKVFMKLRDEKIQEYGVNEIKPGSEHYGDVMKWVEEAFQQDIQIEINPVLSETDIENVPFSLQDVENLVRLGLMADK